MFQTDVCKKAMAVCSAAFKEIDDDEINHLTESLRKLYSALITQP